MKRMALFIFCFLLASLAIAAEMPKVPVGSKVYVAPMRSKLNNFLVTQIAKQKVPLSVVVDENAAEYILTGTPAIRQEKWINTLVGAKDETEWNIQLVNVKNKTVAWAGAAGDGSMWFTSLNRDGPQKAAARIVHKMKKDLFAKK